MLENNSWLCSEIINASMKIIVKQFPHTPISGFQPTGLVPSSPLHFTAVKYGALLTRIQLDLEMELYLRTEFTQISLAKNYILNFVNLF